MPAAKTKEENKENIPPNLIVQNTRIQNTKMQNTRKRKRENTDNALPMNAQEEELDKKLQQEITPLLKGEVGSIQEFLTGQLQGNMVSTASNQIGQAVSALTRAAHEADIATFDAVAAGQGGSGATISARLAQATMQKITALKRAQAALDNEDATAFQTGAGAVGGAVQVQTGQKNLEWYTGRGGMRQLFNLCESEEDLINTITDIFGDNIDDKMKEGFINGYRTNEAQEDKRYSDSDKRQKKNSNKPQDRTVPSMGTLNNDEESKKHDENSPDPSRRAGG